MGVVFTCDECGVSAVGADWGYEGWQAEGDWFHGNTGRRIFNQKEEVCLCDKCNNSHKHTKHI